MKGIMRNGGALAVVIAAFLLACVDFVPTDPAETPEPEPPGPEPARFNGTVQLSTGLHDRVILSARFFPGRDSLGEIRRVTNDTVTVLGRKLVPRAVEPDGALLFSEQWQPRPEDGKGAARLRGPEIAGRERPPPPVEFGFCRGEGPYDLTISPEDTLRFQLSCSRPAEPFEDQAQWTLIVFQDGTARQVLEIGGIGVPPPDVSIPASMLDRGDRSAFTATLSVHEIWGRLPADGDYEAILSAVSQSSWALQWQ